MKKILALIILNLFLNSSAFAEIKNFQCVKLLHYMDENEELRAFCGDEVCNTSKLRMKNDLSCALGAPHSHLPLHVAPSGASCLLMKPWRYNGAIFT